MSGCVLAFDPENVLIVLCDKPDSHTFVCLHSIDGVERNQRDVHKGAGSDWWGQKAVLRQLTTCPGPDALSQSPRDVMSHRSLSLRREGLYSGFLALAAPVPSEERWAGCLTLTWSKEAPSLAYWVSGPKGRKQPKQWTLSL